LILSVDLDATVPPFEQIRAQIAAMAASGVLPPGTRLPPIRQLAADLGVAAGTVSRAYRELEAAGVLTAHGRHGSHIAQPPLLSPHERATQLHRAAAGYARLAAQLGASKQDALQTASTAIDTLNDHRTVVQAASGT
jgi:GntR family transcriptional regulator